MARERIPPDVQAFVVQQLAMFETPSAIVASVNKEFGHVITRQSVEKYDPSKVAGQNIKAKWRELHAATRKLFLEDTAGIAVSHRAVRLRALQRMAEKAEERGNMVLAASLLEQVAKEMGEAYTNKRLHEHAGPGGGPIQHALPVRSLTDEEIEQRLAEIQRRGSAASSGASAPKEGA